MAPTALTGGGAIAACLMRRTCAPVAIQYLGARPAQQSATHAGTDAGEAHDADWTAFGPTNVSLHRIDVLARFEDGWSALEAAESMDDRAVQGLAQERRAGYLITKARAQLLTRKKESAAVSLVAASRLAPEEFKGRPSTVALVKDVVGATAVPSGELRALAARCGLPA
ncbi:hypothetical protein ACWCPT_18385 [Streptomyces sp. NPDC002308]